MIRKMPGYSSELVKIKDIISAPLNLSVEHRTLNGCYFPQSREYLKSRSMVRWDTLAMIGRRRLKWEFWTLA
jgi:hypothetical protein